MNDQERKRRRRELAKRYHPDVGGDASAFIRELADHPVGESTSERLVFSRPSSGRIWFRSFQKRLRRFRRKRHQGRVH